MSTADDITAAVRIKGLSDAYADEAQNFHAPEADEARTALFEAIDALASERDALLEALRVALRQLETLGGKRRKHPNEGQDEIHAEVLEQIDAAIKASEGKAA
jgi:hypothetical protein